MDISFQDHQFARQCSQKRLLQRKQGAVRARKISQRLGLLSAAKNLADMRDFPGRCHELKHDRSGQLALYLDHPYRRVFEPAHDPVPCKADGGLDWTAVTAVLIIGVEDYHD